MAIDKKYTILISASYRGHRRNLLNKTPKYIGNKVLYISNKTYSTSTNYNDKDAHPHHTEFAHNEEILDGIKNKSEKSYLLKYNKIQFNKLLNDIYNLDIERKKPKLDKTNKERLQRKLKNSETIKSRMEEWFLDRGYSKSLDKILERYSKIIRRKPRGISALTQKRYKKVSDKYWKLKKENKELNDEQLINKLSKIDFYNKKYTPSTIKDILDKKKYLREPTKENV